MYDTQCYTQKFNTQTNNDILSLTKYLSHTHSEIQKDNEWMEPTTQTFSHDFSNEQAAHLMNSKAVNSERKQKSPTTLPQIASCRYK